MNTGAKMALIDPPEQPAMADHPYVWSITGRCLHIGCGRTRLEHPLATPVAVVPADDCDHPYQRRRMVLDDDGLRWAPCAHCGVPMEPKAADKLVPSPIGPEWGPGRDNGWLNPRQRRKWEAIAYRFKGKMG